jgi:pimeloyl-ACP methyl ester carboxylesterase
VAAATESVTSSGPGTATEAAGAVELEVCRLGAGPPVLFLHGENGLLFCRPFLERLAERCSVIAPSHPAWGHSVRPAHVTSIDDIAYVYLDYLDALVAATGSPVVVAGASIGAWIAAEMATKSTAGMAALVLAAPIGVKFGTREERAFIDLYAVAPEEARAGLYGDLASAPDLASLDDDGFLQLAVNEEAVIRFGWEPYLHNPKLRHRLHRIDAPTVVVAGGADRFVLEPDYAGALASLIGANASTRTIPDAGHRLEEEAPDALAAVIAELATDPTARDERR